jgi:hypothetical protein
MDYTIADESIPRHVESEFVRYSKCGILVYGFMRTSCVVLRVLFVEALGRTTAPNVRDGIVTEQLYVTIKYCFAPL